MNEFSIPNRLVLEDVPQVKFFDGGPRCPEDITLPSVMRALMEYLEEEDFGCRTCRAVKPGCKIPCTYTYFIGMTGSGSFLSWKKGWEGDNVALFYMDPDAAAVDRRAFWAAGYAWEYVEKEDGADNQARFLQRIVESLQRGVPVVAYGVIGPPEPCLVTGIDEHGEVLVGWNFFQNFPDFNQGVTYEPCGYFRKPGWLAQTECLVIVGEKEARPPLETLYREAFEAALKTSCTPMVHPEVDAPAWYQERANGLAAYDAWVEQILNDEDFPEDEGVLRQRHDVHNNAVGHIAEARWYGSQFFIQACNSEVLHYSLVEDLLHAAACYAAEHDLMWKAWNLVGGNGYPEAYKNFAQPTVRRQIAEVIQEARRQDGQAAGYLENALEKMRAT